MNKQELIAKMAAKAGLSQKDAGNALNALIETVTDALADDDRVQLVGFGTFEVGKRAARVGRNPQTGEEIKIKATKLPKFKPGKAFKGAIG